MGKRFGGLRLVPLVLALAVALSACGFSTDTVATVGGSRITRGELNAAVESINMRLAQRASQSGTPPQTASAAAVLPDLITSKLVELAARDNKIRVTDAELAAENEAIMKALAAGGQQARGDQITALTTSAARELRPVVNSYGGSGIPDADLQTATRTEIDRLLNLLAVRGTQLAVGPTGGIPERTIKDEAIVFRNALAGRGVALPPKTLEPLIASLLQRLSGGLYAASDADYVQALFAQEGIDSAVYRQIVRERVLQEKLRPQWAPAEVEAVVLQELRTDTREKALEAIQKGRAGTPFAELLQTYQLPGVPPAANDNTIPNSVVIALEPQLRSAFKVVQAGEFSEPLATADNSQFFIYRIVRTEKRAPTDEEAEPLFQQWLTGLRSTYPVTIIDPALNASVR